MTGDNTSRMGTSHSEPRTTEEDENPYPTDDAEERIREWTDELLSHQPVIKAEELRVEGDLFIGSKTTEKEDENLLERCISYTKNLIEERLLLIITNVIWAIISLI